MSKEYEIIEYLGKSQDISQRKIAEKTGLSLGMVNILLQRMVKKGLIKIERLNARSLRYILTPKGIAEKSKRTYKYIKNSYDYIIQISYKVQEMYDKARALEVKQIYLYGPQNEVYHIIKLALKTQKIPFKHTSDKDALDKDDLVMIWESGDEQRLDGIFKVINIIKTL